MIDLLEDELVGEGALGLDAVCRSLAVRNKEACLLSSQVIHLCHELADACADVNCQLGILKYQIARINNNVSCLANRPSKCGCSTPPAVSFCVICDEEVAEPDLLCHLLLQYVLQK